MPAPRQFKDDEDESSTCYAEINHALVARERVEVAAAIENDQSNPISDVCDPVEEAAASNASVHTANLPPATGGYKNVL